ncbi:MAG: class I SAM-dependent methyltransferase [Bacteriovoracaceae bacterium]|nr:class I SAM-dependent methyltransferase [Bacteriovoracaceae bacterium]
MIKNRLSKNLKKLKSWIKQNDIEAFRLYDRDIPEYPFIVDIVSNYALVYKKINHKIDNTPEKLKHLEHLTEALKELFNFSDKNIVVKSRLVQKGKAQYKKLAKKDDYLIIKEHQAKLYINLYDYLDIGLFLDHRPLRQIIYKQAKGKRFLNLFSYTASVSVFAALGGAITTNVDMSNQYTSWAKDNFKLNDLDLKAHQFVSKNALTYLDFCIKQKQKYDIIFLDPSTFSNSKQMDSSFEVEADQVWLMEKCMQLLDTGGVLYFSNNKLNFLLSEKICELYDAKDITKKTIPIDYRNKKIHQCYQIKL